MNNEEKPMKMSLTAFIVLAIIVTVIVLEILAVIFLKCVKNEADVEETGNIRNSVIQSGINNNTEKKEIHNVVSNEKEVNITNTDVNEVNIITNDEKELNIVNNDVNEVNNVTSDEKDGNTVKSDVNEVNNAITDKNEVKR